MRFFIRFFITFALLRLTVEAATIGNVTNVTGGVSDMVLDEPRQRLYLVRPSPYDAIDVYSITQRRVISSIRTDSLPLAAALSRDGSRLYVTCHNSSSLNVIDNDKLVIVGKISLPARPEGVPTHLRPGGSACRLPLPACGRCGGAHGTRGSD